MPAPGTERIIVKNYQVALPEDVMNRLKSLVKKKKSKDVLEDLVYDYIADHSDEVMK